MVQQIKQHTMKCIDRDNDIGVPVYQAMICCDPHKSVSICVGTPSSLADNVLPSCDDCLHCRPKACRVTQHCPVLIGLAMQTPDSCCTDVTSHAACCTGICVLCSVRYVSIPWSCSSSMLCNPFPFALPLPFLLLLWVLDGLCHCECARVRMDAKSNLKPSTCISTTQ